MKPLTKLVETAAQGWSNTVHAIVQENPGYSSFIILSTYGVIVPTVTLPSLEEIGMLLSGKDPRSTLALATVPEHSYAHTQLHAEHFISVFFPVDQESRKQDALSKIERSFEEYVCAINLSMRSENIWVGAMISSPSIIYCNYGKSRRLYSACTLSPNDTRKTNHFFVCGVD